MENTLAHPNVPASVLRMLSKLAQDPHVEGLILFGSRAIGDHDERSDVDVAVRGREISVRALQYEGRMIYAPRESVREAFAYGWLDDEDAWLKMLDRRNLTTHEDLSDALVKDNYESVRDATPKLRAGALTG